MFQRFLFETKNLNDTIISDQFNVKYKRQYSNIQYCYTHCTRYVYVQNAAQRKINTTKSKNQMK